MTTPRYQTTSEQRQQLMTDGYVLLSGAVPADLLARWRALATRLEADALDCIVEVRVVGQHGAHSTTLGGEVQAGLGCSSA